MKYQVDIDKMANFLRNRPAMVKVLTNLTEGFVLKVLSKEFHRRQKTVDFYRALPIELKTLEVTRMYIASCSSWCLDYSVIPQAIREQLTSDDRKAMLEKKTSIIDELNDATPTEWEHALEHGYRNYHHIPKNLWTKKLILLVAKENSYDFDLDLAQMPITWDETFAEALVDVNHKALKEIPVHVISNRVFKKACRQNLSGIQIPTDAWDGDCIKEALECQASNIKYIPNHLITKEIVFKCAEEGVWEDLPYRDYDVLVHYISGNPHSWNNPKGLMEMLSKVNPKKFISDAIKLGADPSTIKSFGFTITEDLWQTIIEINPRHLKEIPKADQSEAIIETFFSNAGYEIIDDLQNHINLGKIKAHHAPLLVNCRSGLITEIRNKFMKGDQEKGGDNTIEIDVSPSEFAKIKGLLIDSKE
jgi:hypothetical protein